MRNIKSKLDYLKWRLQQSSIKPSKKDLIALNDIIIALNDVSEVKRKDNSNLMKFMIHYFDSFLMQSLKNNKSNFLDLCQFYHFFSKLFRPAVLLLPL